MKNWIEYYTTFTKEADKYLRPSLRSTPFHTYILDANHKHDDIGEVYLIRFLGSTKGIIHAANGIITSIELDDYACFSKLDGCYHQEAESALYKYIGHPIKEGFVFKAEY